MGVSEEVGDGTMNEFKEQIALLNTIERYFRISEATTVKGLMMLDVPETKGWIIIKFRCPDRQFPEYSFDVEFRVTKPFFEKHLRKLLEIE
jgi:hypothetical protein